MPDEVTTSNQGPTKATSRLALLTAFIAGAFAAWILITINIEQQRAADLDDMAALSIVSQRPVATAKPAKPVKSAPAVTVHTSTFAKPGPTKAAASP